MGKLDPEQPNNPDFCELVQFLAAVSTCYKDILLPKKSEEKDSGVDLETSTPTSFPGKIAKLLTDHAIQLNPDIRMALCRVMMTMRNKSVLEPLFLHKLCFKLFVIPDKDLREVLYSFILNDIKSINQKNKNNQLNKQLQNHLFGIINANNNKTSSKICVDLLVELYKRNVWRDVKTVNVLGSACFSKFATVVRSALMFFIEAGISENNDSDAESDSDDDDDPILNGPSAEDYIMRQVGASSKSTKKLRKKKAKASELLEKLKKKRKRMKVSAADGNFAALHLIYDPQEFAEKLFKTMQRSKEKFDMKLLFIDLIAGLIGIHELFLLNFYSYCERWLNPHQRNVTKVLVSLALASHELVPPETLQQTIRIIADNFVVESNSAEVMAVGINSIREISNRCPLAMTEELLRDLAEYKKHRVKAVSAASKSLLQVWREKNSKMLVRRDRGRPTEENLEEKMVEYGEQRVTTEIPGLKDLSGEIDENGEKLPTGADFILSQEDFKNIKINELKRKLKLNKKQERADKRRKIGENGDLSSGDETDSDIEREIETSELKTDQEILRNKSTRTEVLSKKSVLFVEGAKRDVSKDARMQSIKDGREDQDKNKMK